MNYQLEMMRNNVTLAEFFAAIRQRCKKQGIDFYLDRNDFENPPTPYNASYFVKDGIKYTMDDGYSREWSGEDAPCEAEICRTLPLEHQIYIRNFDGSFYNEICEFSFWDGKKGTGYYYQANKDSEN